MGVFRRGPQKGKLRTWYRNCSPEMAEGPESSQRQGEVGAMEEKKGFSPTDRNVEFSRGD